jgi:MFS superfamily sulfate permease-like transporter
MRFDAGEVSGSLGDLGTFIPLVVSLVAVCNLDLGSILLFSGLYNVATGFLFNQPIPVQPMKAIAAVAIAETLAPGSIAAAGLGSGAIVLLLGVSGVTETIERWIPRPVVRGIQLGVGLKLLIKGVSLIDASSSFSLDGWVLAVAAGGFVLVTSRFQRFPSALVLFGAGMLLLVISRPELLNGLSLGWAGPHLTTPTSGEWRQGLLWGTLPQLPLTILNSVIAVCALSGDLFPTRRVSTRQMAISVGLMNLTGCWFGAMPMCHGAGGLAGQYRFGARTGGSVVLLGVAKLTLALALGSSAIALLAAYPAGILGVLLGFAGVELALPARDCRGRDGSFLALLTAGGCLALNTALGFALGISAATVLGWIRRSDDR